MKGRAGNHSTVDGREVEPDMNGECPVPVEQYFPVGSVDGQVTVQGTAQRPTVKDLVEQVKNGTFEPATLPEPLSRAPEIRYRWRDAHHVTCLVAGGACTCLEWREKLIAESAAEFLRIK